MSEWVLTIPESLPSQNETERRAYRCEGPKNRKRWARMIMVGAAIAKIPDATGKRRVVIERHASRRFDRDNQYGGAKGFVDELKKFGLLVNDSPKWLDLVNVHVPLGKGEKAHTLVRLEDVS